MLSFSREAALAFRPDRHLTLWYQCPFGKKYIKWYLGQFKTREEAHDALQIFKKNQKKHIFKRKNKQFDFSIYLGDLNLEKTFLRG